jgi:hypothetical protein
VFAPLPPAALFVEGPRVLSVQTVPLTLEPIPKPLDQSAIGLTEPDVEVWMASKPTVLIQRPAGKEGPLPAEPRQRAASGLKPEVAFSPLTEESGSQQALAPVRTAQKSKPRSPSAQMPGQRAE